MKHLIGLVLASVLSHLGCAHQPPQGQSLSEEIRTKLGRVAMVSARYTPTVEFELPAKGSLAGAGRGFARGTAVTIVLVPSLPVYGGLVGAQGREAGFIAGVFLGAAVAAVTGAGYMVGGPVYGAMAAPSAGEVQRTDTLLREAVLTIQVQRAMQDRVVQVARSRAGVALQVLHDQGPETPSDLLTYIPAQGPDVDTILELRVNTIRLKVPDVPGAEAIWTQPSTILKIDPPLALVMETRGRLIRTKDRTVLYDQTWAYQGGDRTFAEWGAEQGKPLAEEFERAYDELAKQIVDRIFMPSSKPKTPTR